MFLRLLSRLQSGAVKRIFSEDHSGILRVQMIPNGKSDMNDIKNAPIRLALHGTNDNYPEGGTQVRQRIVDEHRRYTQGRLYFLQNDPEVPSHLRDEAREWGLARDEFQSTGHFAPRLYIREARRIVGRYIFREQDTFTAPGSVRAPLHIDSIAIGDYTLNCHGVQPPGPLHPTVTEGDFAFSTQPFQIPYGVILPQRVENLLVPVAVSATHVGFSAIRLEPTWSALGHAAGLAAHLAVAGNSTPAAVAVSRLQALLHQTGAATIYFSDVPPSHPLFHVAQYFGTRGFFPASSIRRRLRLRRKSFASACSTLTHLNTTKRGSTCHLVRRCASPGWRWLRNWRPATSPAPPTAALSWPRCIVAPRRRAHRLPGPAQAARAASTLR
jgi:hypothetical protein